MTANPTFWKWETGSFHPCHCPLDRFRSHSTLQPLKKTAASHPQIAQRRQRYQVGRVFGQARVLNLRVSELTLDDADWVFYLSPDTGLFQLEQVRNSPHERAFVQRTALARAHGRKSLGRDVLRLLSLGHPMAARIGKHIGLFTMNQLAGLCDVIDVGRRAHHGVNQARVSVCTNVALHGKVQLVPLLGLMHLGVELPISVLGRTECGNQGGIEHRAYAQHQAFVGLLSVGSSQDWLNKLVLFQQMAKAQDADPVENAFDAAQRHKLPVQHRHKQGLSMAWSDSPNQSWTKWIRSMYSNIQHERQKAKLSKRCVRRNQRQQHRPRHDERHLVHENRLSRASLAQIQAKVLLLDEHIVRQGSTVQTAQAA